MKRPTKAAEVTPVLVSVCLQNVREKQHFFKKMIYDFDKYESGAPVIKDIMLPNNCKYWIILLYQVEDKITYTLF